MLACNQNGVTGKLVKRINGYAEKVDVWQTTHKTKSNEGWIGVFNRNPYLELIRFTKEDIGLNKDLTYYLYDIWGQRIIDDGASFIFEIPADDVVFIRYKIK